MHRPDEHRRIENPALEGPVLGADAVGWLIGIDDTDNKKSRGTGYLTRGLAGRLAHCAMAFIEDVTRHQLLIDPRVRYTSRNGALCLHLRASEAGADAIWNLCREHVAGHAAPGSDAGLAMVRKVDVAPSVEAFGVRAQSEFIEREEALAAAHAAGVRIEGLTGDHGGVIGALAAIGLRKAARNGRIAWGAGLRETMGVVTVDELLDGTMIEAVRCHDGSATRQPARGERVRLESWARAVMVDGRAVALVEPAGAPGEGRRLGRDGHGTGTGQIRSASTDNGAKNGRARTASPDHIRESEAHENREAEWTLVGRDVLHDY